MMCLIVWKHISYDTPKSMTLWSDAGEILAVRFFTPGPNVPFSFEMRLWERKRCKCLLSAIV